MPQVSAPKQKVAVPLPSPKDRQTAKTSQMGPIPGARKFRVSIKPAEAVSPVTGVKKPVALTLLKRARAPGVAVRSPTPAPKQVVLTKRRTLSSSWTPKSRPER